MRGLKMNAFRSAMLVLLGAPALAACVSVIPETPSPDAIFKFDAPRATEEKPFYGTVVVREPEGPRILVGRNVVVDAGAGSLTVDPKVRWADNATLMLQFGLVDALNAFGGEGVAISNTAGSRGDIEVFWRLQDLSADRTEARTRFALTILDGRTRDPLAQKVFTTSRPIAGNRTEALKSSATDALAEAAEFVRAFTERTTVLISEN